MDAQRYTAHPEEAGAVPRDVAPRSLRLPGESELVTGFADRIRLFATRWLGNAADAEDVAQETLRRVLEALRADRIRNPAALPAFVYETARHVCQQKNRSTGRENKALQRLHQGDGARTQAASPDALMALVSDERRAALRAALERLGAADRTLLRTLYYEDSTAAEAAHVLAITPAAVRVRKHRALRRLGKLLADDGI